jgi:hypothetical protein
MAGEVFEVFDQCRYSEERARGDLTVIDATRSLESLVVGLLGEDIQLLGPLQSLDRKGHDRGGAQPPLTHRAREAGHDSRRQRC